MAATKRPSLEIPQDKGHITPHDGKLHAYVDTLWMGSKGARWPAHIELRPDPRTPMQDATAIVAYLGGPEPERYATLFAAAPGLLEELKEALDEIRRLKGLAWSGSRIPYERDPDYLSCKATEARIEAAIQIAQVRP